MPRERVHLTRAGFDSTGGGNPSGTNGHTKLDLTLGLISRSLDRVAARRGRRPAPNLKASIPSATREWVSTRSRDTDTCEDLLVSSLLRSAILSEEADQLRAEIESHDLEAWRDPEDGPARRRGAQEALRLFGLEHPRVDYRPREGDKDRLLKIELLAHMPAETRRERSARDEYLDQLHGTYGYVVDARRVGQAAHFVAYLGNSAAYDQYGFMIHDVVRILEHHNLLGFTGARLLRSVYAARPSITTVPKEDWEAYRDDPERLALLRSSRSCKVKEKADSNSSAENNPKEKSPPPSLTASPDRNETRAAQ